ncbi:hypothetical protein SASPL_147728 [Salvia splendens]|uniref:Uncharacterized protein n=1 Tax=Salvia splendens TaxID=180675 RepID=A0A8X8WF13_SALSN|nr:hypothetical protein SASPL_147728 [Salvia splendens]
MTSTQLDVVEDVLVRDSQKNGLDIKSRLNNWQYPMVCYYVLVVGLAVELVVSESVKSRCSVGEKGEGSGKRQKFHRIWMMAVSFPEDSENIEVGLGFGCDMIDSPKETLDNGPCKRKLSMDMKALGSVSSEKDKPERLLEPRGGADCGGDVPVKSVSEIQRLKLITMTRQKLHVEHPPLRHEIRRDEAAYQSSISQVLVA